MIRNEKITDAIERMKNVIEEERRKRNSTKFNEDIEEICKTTMEAIESYYGDERKTEELYELFTFYSSLSDAIELLEKKCDEEDLSEDKEKEIRSKLRTYRYMKGKEFAKINEYGDIYYKASVAFLLYPGSGLTECFWYAAYRKMKQCAGYKE